MKIITLEEHFTTPLFREKLPPSPAMAGIAAQRGKQIGVDVIQELLDMGSSRIAAMDASGIAVQVMSLTAPGCEALDAETAVAVAKDANDRLFEAVTAHPDRLAGFAALPTADPKASAEELERAVKRLGLKGALINGHIRGRYLDDRKYWSIFECAASLDVPIYLHPTPPHPAVMQTYFEGFEEIALPAWGFALETSVHFLRLVFAGVFDAFPRLKFILGHLGEGLPFGIHRLNEHTYAAASRRGLKKRPEQYLRENLVVTTSGNFYTPAFLCTVMAMGVENVLFSVDWPYESNRAGADWFAHLQMSEQDKEKIAHLNAERILHL
ncbi:MAG TPA: amidohydrolase family protein [Candidatus Binataceae bacterium]|nr:amidohydrolase family protein [Candidatus Binataceae bacterium]